MFLFYLTIYFRYDLERNDSPSVAGKYNIQCI